MSEQSTNKPNSEYNLPVAREDLYKQACEEPMLSLAKKYGVSSSYLSRVCSRLNVPRPEREYWAKLAVGKAPKRPSLPELQATDQSEWARGVITSLLKGVSPNQSAHLRPLLKRSNIPHTQCLMVPRRCF